MKYLRVFVLLCMLLLFSGCIATERPIDNTQYLNLLYKSKDFIAFCLYLSSQENPYWNQVISRLYYGYFTLAKLIHTGKTNKFEIVKHDTIWAQNKKRPSKDYGKYVKKMRIGYDYSPGYEMNEKQTNKNLKLIIEQRDTLDILIDDAKDRTVKFYKFEENPSYWINKCEEILTEIHEKHELLMEVIEKYIQYKER